MLMRPQQRYVKEDVMYALRKSMTRRMYTTKLTSGKMTKLLMIVTTPKREDVKIMTRRDYLRSPKPNPKYSSDDYDLDYVGSKSGTRSQRSIRRAGHSSR